MPAKVGTQPNIAIQTALGLGPSLRWGDKLVKQLSAHFFPGRRR